MTSRGHIVLCLALLIVACSTLTHSAESRRTFHQREGGALGTIPPALWPPPPGDSLRALRVEGDRLIREERLEQALGVFKRIAAGVREDLGVLITLADLYSWTGDYDHAIALYKDVVERDSVNRAALKGLARVMRWATRYAEAERYYADVLAIEQGDIDALIGMAQTFAQQHNLERALGYVDQANTIAPDNPEILLTKGDILAWGNQFTAAEETYRVVLKMNPLSVEAYKSLGDLYGWMGRPALAVEMLRKAHQLDRKNPDILIKMANLAIDAGELTLTEESVRTLFALNPNSSYGFDILRRLESRQQVDYAALVDTYAKPAFLVLSNIVIALFFRSRRDRLRKHGGRYWQLAYYVWPVLALLWLAIFMTAKFTGLTQMLGFTDVAEFATLVVWMFAFVTLVWTTRVQQQEKNKVILAIGAHPDDIELGCGGTLSRYKELGYRVFGIVMTAGEAGNPRMHGKIDRTSEAEEGASILGLDQVWIYAFTDTKLNSQIDDMKSVIEEKIRVTGADIIVTQSPHDIHQDHKAVFEATKIAARGNKSLLCYEDVSTEADFAANYYVDVTEYIGDKVRAVQAHRTQKQKYYMNPEHVTGRASHRGLQTGVKYAEAFLLYKGIDLWPS